jgi:hypothetical protein
MELENKNSIKEYSTSLDKKNDTEGLAYDPVSGDLLIACKKESGDEMKRKLPAQCMSLM